MPSKGDLRQKQSLPLQAKVLMSIRRIQEWYDHWNGDVYVSFSGGKDSTVLAHLVHNIYPDVPLVFSNTGLEYPEIQSFARKMGAEFVRPKMRFDEVISEYGYPIIGKEIAGTIYYARKITNRKWSDYPSGRRNQLLGKVGCDRTIDRSRSGLNGERKGKDGNSIFNKDKYLPLCTETQFMISDQCCHQMKKTPLKKYQKETKRYPLIGTMAEESKLRETTWLKHGCNAFESKNKTSQPMSFWTEQDVLKYIKENGLEIASVYGDIVAVDDFGFQCEPIPGIECKLKCTGCQRTGCIFCGFGAHLDKGESRFQRLAKTHPKQYEYCMNGGQWVDNPNYDQTAPEYDGEWKNWNPKKIWVPSKEGLGMKKVFDDCNAI